MRSTRTHVCVLTMKWTYCLRLNLNTQCSLCSYSISPFTFCGLQRLTDGCEINLHPRYEKKKLQTNRVTIRTSVLMSRALAHWEQMQNTCNGHEQVDTVTLEFPKSSLFSFIRKILPKLNLFKTFFWGLQQQSWGQKLTLMKVREQLTQIVHK